MFIPFITGENIQNLVSNIPLPSRILFGPAAPELTHLSAFNAMLATDRCDGLIVTYPLLKTILRRWF
jgi:hypothetical protein